MSKAKLVNELVKMKRAGMEPRFAAGETTPNSRPDKNAVGVFYTSDGGCRIAKT
ncbi:hypothetical protein [Sinorhizobium meliloti]|uniref:hypothetical protein n=1 Tax=Rhizobium meliloti TaxID=382 RepID=UPI0013E297E0|nr:hypothetical protein [Sinorhizobium meliloti]